MDVVGPERFLAEIETQIRDKNFSEWLESVGAAGADDLLPRAFEELHASIEELKVAEEELRIQCDELAASRHIAEVNKQRYQDIFEFAPDGNAICNGAGLIREVNRAAARLFNTTHALAVGKPMAAFVAPSHRQTFRSCLRDAEVTGIAQTCEIEIHPRSQTPIIVELTVAPATIDGEAVLRAVLRSAAVRGVAAREQEARADSAAAVTASVLEQVSDAYFALDGDMRLTYINRQAESFWGSWREDVIGRQLADVAPEDLDEAACAKLREALDAKQQVQFDVFADKLGTWIEVKAYPLPEGLSVYCRPIDRWNRLRVGQPLEGVKSNSVDSFPSHLLRAPGPLGVSGLEIETLYRGDRRSGSGDGVFYDVAKLAGNQTALVVGGIEGTGGGATMFAIEMKLTLRALLRMSPRPAAALQRLSDMIAVAGSIDNSEAQRADICVVVINSRTGRAIFACAGSEPPVVIARDGAQRAVITHGSTIGVGDGIIIDEVERFLNVGDTVLISIGGLLSPLSEDAGAQNGNAAMLRQMGTLGVREVGDEVLKVIDLRKGPALGEVCLMVSRRTSVPA